MLLCDICRLPTSIGWKRIQFVVCAAGVLGDEGHVEFDQCSCDKKEIECLHEDKEEEVGVVASAHAVVKPLAVMVESVNTLVTDVAVAAAREDDDFARRTDLTRVERLK